ncbi:MAG: serine hydrolase, partial [Rhodanobacter sp.]
MSKRSLSPRLAGCCALLVFASSVWAQAPVPAQTRASAPISTLPVSTDDTVRALLPAQLSDFGAYVDSARNTFDVPGVAVAIVKDGQVVMAQGFGLR